MISQSISQCRPLRRIARLEDPEVRAPCARIDCDFLLVGHDGFAGDHPPERPAPAGADRLPGRTDARAGPLAERVLHQAVLARMVGDDGQRAARPQCVTEGRKRVLESTELVVDRDAHRLEQPGELTRTRSRAEDRPNGVYEIVAEGKWSSVPPPHDLAREPPRVALVAVLVEHPDQLALVGLIEKRGGRGSLRAHPHVEWSTRSESKSASGLIQLP